MTQVVITTWHSFLAVGLWIDKRTKIRAWIWRRIYFIFNETIQTRSFKIVGRVFFKFTQPLLLSLGAFILRTLLHTDKVTGITGGMIWETFGADASSNFLYSGSWQKPLKLSSFFWLGQKSIVWCHAIYCHSTIYEANRDETRFDRGEEQPAIPTENLLHISWRKPIVKSAQKYWPETVKLKRDGMLLFDAFIYKILLLGPQQNWCSIINTSRLFHC